MNIISTARFTMKKLLREGVPIAVIARRLGVCRQTIYNWMKAEDDEQGDPGAKRRSSKLAPYRAHISSRLERFDLPATVLFREITGMGYTGGITILREFVAQIKEHHVQRVVDRYETEPGRQAQVDFASCGKILHEGRRRELSLVVVVLDYSRTTWARFVVNQRRETLMENLEAAFRAFGGVPKELLFDNLKQVVAKPRREDREAVVASRFVSFAEHWGFDVVACPVYWPRAKGKVERTIQYIKRSFLEGRSFADLDDLNAQLAEWLTEVANVRIHATTKQRPVDRLEDERPALLPLGTVPAFPSTVVETRLADHDGRISFRGVRYSVDPSILTARRGEPVEVHVATDDTLRIFHEGRLVGEHQIQPKGSKPVDDPLHATLRRALRRRPPGQRPHGKNPEYEQQASEADAEQPQIPPSPEVEVRELETYEEVA